MKSRVLVEQGIALALGLLVLSAAIAIGSVDFTRPGAGEPPILTVDALTNANGGLSTLLPLPGIVQLVINVVLNCARDPHELLVNTALHIKVFGREGTHLKRPEDIAKLQFFAPGSLFAEVTSFSFATIFGITTIALEKLCLFPVPQNAPPNPNVTVIVDPPQTTPNVFTQTPSDKPADEDGWTVAQYQAPYLFGPPLVARVQTAGGCAITLTIQTLSVRISTSITINLPAYVGEDDPLTAHEYGHAAIAEAAANKFGPILAHQNFDPLIGQSVTGWGSDCAAATQAALAALRQLLDAASDQTAQNLDNRARGYQDRYDDANHTNHGQVSADANRRIAQDIIGEIQRDP